MIPSIEMMQNNVYDDPFMYNNKKCNTHKPSEAYMNQYNSNDTKKIGDSKTD